MKQCPYCGAEIRSIEVSLPDKIYLTDKDEIWVESNKGDWYISCQFCDQVFDLQDLKMLDIPIELIQKIRG